MRERFQLFMYGRYGMDELGRFINILTLIILVLGVFLSPQITILAVALLVYEYFRVLSRNAYKRSRENAVYLHLRKRVKRWFFTCKQRFLQRKTHRFYRCPSCRQTLRVPRGKGKISLTCPKCHIEFIKNS